jgi:hypothetical protein
MDDTKNSDFVDARRRFLASCGKFAAITPPVMTVLLASTAQNYAAAGSGHGGGRGHSLSGGNNGWGNGGSDGVPGRSGDNPSPQSESKAADERR